MQHFAAAAAIAAVMSIFVAANPAGADTMKNCAASWKALAKAHKAKTTY